MGEGSGGVGGIVVARDQIIVNCDRRNYVGTAVAVISIVP